MNPAALSASLAKHKHKYVFVVGGVMSGVGKGIISSSIGTILQGRGFKVNLVKVDPYLNVDAGTMNPTEHGEVFVLDSGLETDQDMGNYERFLNRSAEADDYMTSGMVYKHVIDRERALGYRGRCVEAIPDVRDEIIRRLMHAAAKSNANVSVIEIGGTVGDYQNVLFMEAARVMKVRHPDDVIFVMVSYLPVPGNLGEMKSRPTQNAVRQLNSYGINADIIVGRASVPLDHKRKEKIAFACSLPVEHVISAPDIDSIYDVPLNLERDGLAEIILKALHIEGGLGGNVSKTVEGAASQKSQKDQKGLAAWRTFAKRIREVKGKVPNSKWPEVRICVVGKYFSTGDFMLADSYVSVLAALSYSAAAVGVRLTVDMLNAADFEKRGGTAKLASYHGILVPGGFGETGIEGKLAAICYAREKKVPYFGLCYGMQLMVIEYARNVLGWKDAHTAEINPAASKVVVDIMPDQKKKLAEGEYGASMRLGAYEARLAEGTVARAAYKTAQKAGSISERHRHRYEVNPAYIADIVRAGLVFSGKSPDGVLMEIAELPAAKHPFFLGTQFHPEFLARPLAPHPLFTAFLKAAKGHGAGAMVVEKGRVKGKGNGRSRK